MWVFFFLNNNFFWSFDVVTKVKGMDGKESFKENLGESWTERSHWRKLLVDFCSNSKDSSNKAMIQV